jgi:DNA-binding transcriptional MerR regulator
MYTATQLCSEFNITPRRLERWRLRGVIDPPKGGRGKWAYYTDHHYRQIRAVLNDLDNNVTLADLAERYGQRQ